MLLITGIVIYMPGQNVPLMYVRSNVDLYVYTCLRNVCTYACVHACVRECMDGRMDGWMEGGRGGGTDGRTDGGMDGWTDELMGGWMDARTYACMCLGMQTDRQTD